MVRFVALGVGCAVVNGCVPMIEGVVGRPIDGLPEGAYRAIGEHRVIASARVASVLLAMQAGAP